MGKKHKKHKSDKHLYEGEEWAAVGAASPRLLCGLFAPSTPPSIAPGGPAAALPTGRPGPAEGARPAPGGAGPPGGGGVGTRDPWPRVGLVGKL